MYSMYSRMWFRSLHSPGHAPLTMPPAGTMGFKDPILSLVVLSGAHSIGQSRQAPRNVCSRGVVSRHASSNGNSKHGLSSHRTIQGRLIID